MLSERAAKVYVYVVARDFGFAPNPFHGVCTLATCKPDIRRVAQVGDRVIGMGGAALGTVGRCVYAMEVTSTMTFDEYWADPAFRCKRPVRNGSLRVMVGDNIYHREGDGDEAPWRQEDSHHSRPDGSPDPVNLRTDTQTDRVLISTRFVYFGQTAPVVPTRLLEDMDYRNVRKHRTYQARDCGGLLDWLDSESRGGSVGVLDDPHQFEHGGARYSGERKRVLR